MSERNSGLTADPLFVGITRPPMRWGVAYEALLLNLVITMEIFVLTKNLLTLLIAIPIHGICALLCAREARYFHLMLLWVRTRLPAYLGTMGVWHAASYSPLALDLPNRNGWRQSPVTVRVEITASRGSHERG
jgi:type IV secretion system protein VirB3